MVIVVTRSASRQMDGHERVISCDERAATSICDVWRVRCCRMLVTLVSTLYVDTPSTLSSLAATDDDDDDDDAPTETSYVLPALCRYSQTSATVQSYDPDGVPR